MCRVFLITSFFLSIMDAFLSLSGHEEEEKGIKRGERGVPATEGDPIPAKIISCSRQIMSWLGIF